MTYVRGSASLEVEVSRIQSWLETADPDLYGRNGSDIGVIREHRNDRAAREEHDRFMKKMVMLCGLFGAIPAIIELLKVFHIIPK